MRQILLAAVVAAIPIVAQAQSQRLEMQCQQNTDDGRLLVSNGDQLPENARVRIERYRPVRREAGWTYGPCLVVVTPRR